MTAVKKMIGGFKGMPAKQRVQIVAALIVTIVFLVSIPTVAWFNYQRRIAKLQKIEAPNVLYLNAAHREDSINFEINGIDAEDDIVDGYGNPVYDSSSRTTKITHKDYVFSVTGEAVNKFTIQLAYTTNNPFSYELYSAKELLESEVTKTANSEADFVTYTLNQSGVDSNLPSVSGSQYHNDASYGETLYYKIDTSETDGGEAVAGKYNLTYLNRSWDSNSNEDADLTYHSSTYDTYSTVHKDAEPVYCQARNVSAIPGSNNLEKEAFARTFILRVTWDPGELDNDLKETDIIYISVKAQS